jgi:hypothetical protein
LSVLSETAACRTVAEGVALVEAAERSAGIYMFAENYPYMPFTREMRRRHQAGDIGEVRDAEAEYLDEPADLARFARDRAHWRARTPATYYCTHSLAPVAAITGTRPVEVSGFVVPTATGPEALDRARRGRGWRDAARFTTGAIRVLPDRKHIQLPRIGPLKTHQSTRKLARRVEQGTARISQPPSVGPRTGGLSPSPSKSIGISRPATVEQAW